MTSLLAAALLISCHISAAAGPETMPPPPGQDATKPQIRKIADGIYQIGTVVLDAASRSVRCRGRVNMDEGGPIELLACLPRGKTHESVFVLDVEPRDLQAALLLLGLKEGRNPAHTYPEGSPEGLRPPGDKVLIFFEWHPPSPPSQSGQPAQVKPVRRRAESTLRNVQTDRVLEEAEWVFLGSRFVDGWFAADLDGSLITTYHDPNAILELCHPTVSDDIYYYVDKKNCPPVGTPVELIIQLPPRPEATAGQDGPKGAGPAKPSPGQPATAPQEGK